MKYAKISGVEQPVSRIVYGCANAPMIAGENADELLDEVLARGINTFDTAENYGLSELSLGHWIKSRKNRDRVVIITKGCHPYDGRDRVTPEDLRHDIEQSFARLGTDYIDVYLLHRDDLSVSPGAVTEILNEYHRAGKIGAFGGSNWTHERIAEANRYAGQHNLEPFRVSSPNFGLCRQIKDPWGGGPGSVTISGEEHAQARAWYLAQQMPVIAYSGLGRGMFSGRVHSGDMEAAKQILDEFAVKGYCYPENFERLRRAEELAKEKGGTVPQIALAWLLNQELTVFPVVSTLSRERLAENAGAAKIRLSSEEIKWLDLQ